MISGRRSGRSAAFGQVQSWEPLLAHDVGRVIQICVGTTLESQNRGGSGESL